MHNSRRIAALVLPAAVALSLLANAGAAHAETPAAGWSIGVLAKPTRFSPADTVTCEYLAAPLCDTYMLVVHNTGAAASHGTITVTDELPANVSTTGRSGAKQAPGGTEPPGGYKPAPAWSCNGSGEVTRTVKCVLNASVPAGGYVSPIEIPVIVSEGATGALTDVAKISGDGAEASSPPVSTPISSEPAPFGLVDFGFAATGLAGQPSLLAGAHPANVTVSFAAASVAAQKAEGTSGLRPVKLLRDVIVELPLGMIGDPLAAPRCAESQLATNPNGGTRCPAASRVGAIAFEGLRGTWVFSGSPKEPMSYIYNMTPDGGYPAEFGFNYLGKPVHMYASVVHGRSGYRVRVAVPGLPETVSVEAASLTFFGNPAAADESGAGVAETAFLSNPSDCSLSSADAEATIEANSWEAPGSWVSRSAPVYQGLTGCDTLASGFSPSLEMSPTATKVEAAPAGATSQAGQPSGYGVNLEVPQTSLFGEAATASLDEVKVTLPQGVAVSPSAASGLAGCQAEGAEGINIGSGNLGHEGQDLQDPEATVLGPDGLYHTAPGHCPAASRIGTVEITTPLLPKPLTGHVYLAAPKCDPCGAADAEGAPGHEMLGLYLEAAESTPTPETIPGAIIKLKGAVAANATTGQLTADFRENPQLPFSDLKLRFNEGPRATLANPPTCGSYAVDSQISSWAAPGQARSATSPFGVSFNGAGEACPGSLPFSPTLTAGSQAVTAAGYTSFALGFGRPQQPSEAAERSEQNLSRISVQMPPGLLGMVSHVTQCGEAEAQAGTCASTSEIGSATALVGPGSEPYTISGGKVFLTGPYRGSPFGLSIVMPATAGPFTLAGNTGRGQEVVRAAIAVNPLTAAITVTSEPLPHVLEGVPLRLHSVAVNIDRAGFMRNPTNCSRQQIGATISGEPARPGEAAASVSEATPFEAGGCQNLSFTPGFAAETHAYHTRKGGSYLKVDVTSNEGQANVKSVHVVLPKKLPADLATLKAACSEAQFAANPGGCPKASLVGAATAHTPVLNQPLTGPAIFVSHGHAAFPNLDIVLQGEGVTVILEGETDIKKGFTSSTFATVPDVPISSFDLTLPEGEDPALGGNGGNLCAGALTMPTTIIGQNGAVVERATRVKVAGCKPTKRPKPKLKLARARSKRRGRALVVAFKTFAKGRVTVRGKDVVTVSRTLKAGRHSIRVKLRKKVRHRHSGAALVEVRLNVMKRTTTKSLRIKL
ncbi:MAG: hypothetical protein ACYCUM_05655 [Solirubrobacteraceae bacterium]